MYPIICFYDQMSRIILNEVLHVFSNSSAFTLVAAGILGNIDFFIFIISLFLKNNECKLRLTMTSVI